MTSRRTPTKLDRFIAKRKSRLPPPQTFLGVRHAFLPHEGRRNAWRTPKNVCGEAKITLALLCFCDTRALRARRDYKPRGSLGASRVITLLTKLMKRRNTDCRRFQKRRDWTRKRLKFTVKIIFFRAAIGSKNYARQEYLSNGLGTADQPLMGFTVSFTLQWTV